MKTTDYKLRFTFTEPLLATCSGNKELHEEFIASKCPTTEGIAEELESLPEALEKAMTVFPLTDNKAFLWDYQVRGYIKESLGVFKRIGTLPKELKAYKKIADDTLFVRPRQIFLLNPEGKPLNPPFQVLQRPLRGQTAQGERIALASSQQVPAGTRIEFTLVTLLDISEVLNDLLVYGEFKGLGQWRNGGWGRFKAEQIA